MGKLADDMTRLSEEIRAMRAERHAFVEDLKTTVVKMRSEYKNAHAQMARESRAERQAVVDDLVAARRAWAGLGAEQPVGPTVKTDLDLDQEVSKIQAEVKKAEGGSGRGRKRARS